MKTLAIVVGLLAFSASAFGEQVFIIDGDDFKPMYSALLNADISHGAIGMVTDEYHGFAITRLVCISAAVQMSELFQTVCNFLDEKDKKVDIVGELAVTIYNTLKEAGVPESRVDQERQRFKIAVDRLTCVENHFRSKGGRGIQDRCTAIIND